MIIVAKRQDGTFGYVEGFTMKQVREVVRNLESLRVPCFYGAERDGMTVKYGKYWTKEHTAEYNRQTIAKCA